MAEPFLGEIRLMALNRGVRGWAACNGQLLPIAQNQALFALLGTTYGGDGVTTFALPDLRGRAPMGFGQGPGLSNRTQGEVTGTEQVTLITTQLPAHRHGMSAVVAPATEVDPTGHRFAEPEDEAFALPADAPMNASGPAGGGMPHENQPPSLVLRYLIALQGIFPARN